MDRSSRRYLLVDLIIRKIGMMVDFLQVRKSAKERPRFYPRVLKLIQALLMKIFKTTQEPSTRIMEKVFKRTKKICILITLVLLKIWMLY